MRIHSSFCSFSRKNIFLHKYFSQWPSTCYRAEILSDISYFCAAWRYIGLEMFFLTQTIRGIPFEDMKYRSQSGENFWGVCCKTFPKSCELTKAGWAAEDTVSKMMVKVEIANFKLQRYYCLIFLFTWFLNSSILSANLVLLLLLCHAQGTPIKDICIRVKDRRS